MTRDQDDVRFGFRDAGGHRADTNLGHQLYVNPGLRVGVLEIVYELSQIFDGVDVMVRWRGDKADTGSGMPGLGDPGIDLLAW